jgi:hypothetical protein
MKFVVPYVSSHSFDSLFEHFSFVAIVGIMYLLAVDVTSDSTILLDFSVSSYRNIDI